jgi:hypothetical protein
MQSVRASVGTEPRGSLDSAGEESEPVRMRPLHVLGLLIALCLGVSWLYFALASAETQIEWAIEDMLDGYADGDVGDCIEYLAKDWSHEQSPGANREYMAQGLRGQRLQDMQSRADRRAVIDGDSLEIQVTDATATSSMTARFFRSGEGSEEALEWHARLFAEWHQGDGGWEIVRTRHENLSGKRPR